MAYAGRQNIYDATIRRMVIQALEDREREFHRCHGADTDEQLLRYLRESSVRLGHTPWPGEMEGGSLIEIRFGSWPRALASAGLPKPTTLNRFDSFARVKEETERQKQVYRQKKAQKKLVAEKRRIQQAKKKAAKKK